MHIRHKLNSLLIITFSALLLCACSKPNSIKPTIGPITESVYAIGIVKSERSYELKMGVVTAIKQYFVKEGDYVKANQNLFMNDSGTVFKAPFEGVITHLPFSVGETVAPQQSILTLVDLKKLYLEASLEQQGILKVKRGQHVQISFESFRSQAFQGTVKNILPRDLEFVIQVEVNNLPENILPGMNADLSVEIMKKDKAILLPLVAVSNGHILIKEEDKSKKVPVTIGVSDTEFVEILDPVLSRESEIVLPKESKK